MTNTTISPSPSTSPSQKSYALPTPTKPKRYQYPCGLVYNWLYGNIHDEGAKYTGCTSVLIADRDVLWAGHRSIPFAVINRPLNTVMVTSFDGSPFSGAVSDAIRMIMRSPHEFEVKELIPKSERKSGREYEWYKTSIVPLPNALTPIVVDRVTLEHTTCDLETLRSDAHAWMERVFQSNLRGRTGFRPYSFTGFWSHDGYGNDHKSPFGFTKEMFSRAGIEWDESWDRRFVVYQAKRKLKEV